MEEYGSIKRAVLELINQYTIAGEAVALSYNNQADYVLRIPNLINQGIMKIRTVFPQRRAMELAGGERRGDWMRFSLPADCRSLVSGGVYRLAPDGAPEGVEDYRLAGGRLWVPDAGRTPRPGPPRDGPYSGEPLPGVPEPASSGVFAEYLAYPEQLPLDPADGCTLDETPDVIQAAEYYAAAMLVLMEDQSTSASLMNEYEARLEQMRPRITAEFVPVRDVYGFGV